MLLLGDGEKNDRPTERRDDKSVFAKEALKECDSHTTHEAEIPLKEHFDANVCPFIANERCHRHHNIVLTSGLVRSFVVWPFRIVFGCLVRPLLSTEDMVAI